MTKFNITDDGTGKRAVTIYLSTGETLVVEGTNPNYDEIVSELTFNDPVAKGISEEELEKLANPIKLIGTKLLSERVKIVDGLIYFDGDAIDNSITQQIVRVLEAGKEDWKPVVNFLEKIATNPSKRSRDQLYDWLNSHNFTVLEDGDILGYKSVKKDPNTVGQYLSINGGEAIINGEPHKNGSVPQKLGDVIEIARSKVDDNPNASCSIGLHVGTYGYASSFSGDTVLLVRVNPRDVVSVPHGGTTKLRTCRYTNLSEATKEITDPFYDTKTQISAAQFLSGIGV